MLSLSARTHGDTVDINGVVAGGEVATGIPGDRALLAFAEVCLGDDAAAIAGARGQVMEELGEAAMVDAACIVANFQRMVRIADGTGIPLDPQMAAVTAGLRKDLGINGYSAASLTPEPGWAARLLARLMKPFLPAMMRRRTAPQKG